MAENYLNATKPVRSYEISIWTLQDRFLSVLKWANQDCKGQIQEPEMVLRDDGTEELSFTIPKYYYAGVTKIENPLWLHLDNQPLEANMHKLKVIFNKGTSDEGIFEFLVTSVAHDHNADELDLTVKAEGLAFHELGKIGYRISLSKETYVTEINEYDNKKLTTENLQEKEPVQNIQYWNDLIFKDSDGHWKGNWCYRIEMDWSSYNNVGEERKENIVYEDEYTSSWQLDENRNELVPRTIEGMREKQRPVEISESNLYNVTQTIAEQFGVYCRYEYAHDEDYSIKAITEDGAPGRTVVYYNNYYQDKQGHIDLTYPYSSSAITRTVDNSEIISKMYVQTVEEGDNEVSIMDVDANKSKEDYLLNFDYLHEIQAITDEQYAEIPKYEEQMHNLNEEIIMLREHINVIKNQLVDVNAKITTLTNSITEAINQSDEAAKEASGITGKPVLTDINTSLTVIDSSEDNANWGNYVNVQRWPGLSKESIELFENNNYSGKATQYSGPITQFSIQYDDDGLTIVRLTNIIRNIDETNDHQIYMRAKYDPYSYYSELAERWKNRAIQDKAALKEAEAERDTLNYYLYGSKGSNAEYLGAGMADNDSSTIESSDYISTEIDEMRVLSESQATAWQSNEDWQNSDPFANANLTEISDGGLEGRLKTALKNKAALFNKFEKMMGPAMREGYWQPDDFNDYGHRYNDSFAINILGSPDGSSSPTTEYLEFLWDDKKYYDNESPIIYNVGINNSINEHLAINASALLNNANFFSHLDNIAFAYIDPSVLITIQELEKRKNNSSFNSDNLFPLLNLNDKENGIQLFDVKEELKYYPNYQNLNATLSDLANTSQWSSLKPSNPTIFNTLEGKIAIINTILGGMDWLIGQERGFKEEGYSDRVVQLQKNIEVLKKIIPVIEDDYLTEAARVQSWIPAQIDQLKENQWRVYRLGGGCEFGWISDGGSSPVFSLIITGAEQLPDSVIKFLREGKYKKESLSVVDEKYIYSETDLSKKYDAYIGYYEDKAPDTIIRLLSVPCTKENYITGERFSEDRSAGITWENYSKKRVYPRLYFKTIKLKDYSSTLKISAKKTMLKNNEDYYIVPDDRAKGMEDSQAGYYLTFKPAALLKNQQDKLVPFELVYVLSNADTAIYLDAIKVMKENSRPKVEYNVELSLLNSTFIHTAYKRLNQIVHINDNDLHLEDVAGYISAVTLKLDRFWEDQVEIKNYETKFEDLFSTIVAQSEAMKKSAGGIKSAIQAFTSTGLIDGDLLQDSLFNNEDINFQFNNGQLTIDNVNGIWGRSTSRDGVEGVVAFRGGGIFTANKKDENGNWIWNTGIVPSGINASLITSGQLDTNRIKIYAGNEVRFQLNGNGLFAYKAFPADSDLTSSAEYGEALSNGDTTTSLTGVDSLQYVKYDSEGLALIAKKGTWYKGLDNDSSSKYMQTIPDEIKRVEISWNGLILRNWSGKDVFYADPDTGNLTLEGSVVATSGYLGGWKLTENELSSKGIRLISAPDDDAGIELNPDMIYAKTAVDKDGNRLYAHYGLDGQGNMISNVIYYLTEEKNGNIGKNDDIYVEEVTPTSVRPKYVHVDTSYNANEQISTTSESGGTNEDDHYTLTAEGSQTTENTGYTAYVMLANDHITYALYNVDKKITYTFNANGLDAEWLELLKTCTNLPTGKTADDYVIYTYTSSFINLRKTNADTETETNDTTPPIPAAVQPQGYKEITFQAKASDGQVIIKKGKIGAFDLNFEDGLSGGKIYDTKFDITNKLMGINDNKDTIEIPMGELFYDLITDSDAGTFTLKKVNGNIANFNIASMAAYRRAIEAAAAVTLTVTVDGSGKVTAVATSGGGVTITKDTSINPDGRSHEVTVTARTQGASVSRTVIVQADGTPSLSPGSGSSGGGSGYCEVCQSTCFKTCASNCQGGCKNSCTGTCKGTCVAGCGTGCELDCTGSCLNACAEACAESCTDSCTNGCQGACGGACSNNCVSLCGQTCASSCQTNCVHRNYSKS